MSLPALPSRTGVLAARTVGRRHMCEEAAGQRGNLLSTCHCEEAIGRRGNLVFYRELILPYSKSHYESSLFAASLRFSTGQSLEKESAFIRFIRAIRVRFFLSIQILFQTRITPIKELTRIEL